MPYHLRDLRKRKGQPYTGKNPIQARWTHPLDPRVKMDKSFPNRTKAHEEMARWDADARLGQWVDPRDGDVTLGEIAEEWFSQASKRWQESHVAHQRNALDAWLNPTHDPKRKTDPIGRRYPLTGRRVGALETRDVERWRDEIYGPRSLKTARKQFAMLNGILTYAVKAKCIGTNPCASVSSLRAAPVAHTLYVPGVPAMSTAARAERFYVLDAGQIDTLAAAFTHPDYAVAVEFDAWMGLRASELWSLTRKDFDLLHGTVRVERSFKEINGYLKVGPLKTASAYRTITMPASIARLIARHLAERVDPEPDSLVFRTVTGAAVRHNTFFRTVYVKTARAAFPERTALVEAALAAAAEAGAPGRKRKRTDHIAPFRFHDLRHTAASLMIDAIQDASALIVVKERLGHKDIATTVNVYSHLLPQGDRDVAKALERRRAEHRPALRAIPAGEDVAT